MPLFRRTLLGFAFVVSMALIACGSSKSSPTVATIPSPTPKPAPNASRFVSAMTPALQTIVKQQEWFTSLTEDGVRLAKAIQECEREAIRNGEDASVPAMLSDAADQECIATG